MKLNEDLVLANADYLYNDACNEDDARKAAFLDMTRGPGLDTFGNPTDYSYHKMYPARFDRVIGPRSTRAAIKAIVRGINEMLESATEAEKTKLANHLLDEMMA